MYHINLCPTERHVTDNTPLLCTKSACTDTLRPPLHFESRRCPVIFLTVFPYHSAGRDDSLALSAAYRQQGYAVLSHEAVAPAC